MQSNLERSEAVVSWDSLSMLLDFHDFNNMVLFNTKHKV